MSSRLEPLQLLLSELIHTRGPIRMSPLVSLSQLSLEEGRLFSENWRSVPVERRRAVLSQMAELAEADPLIDFNAAFMICLDDPDPEVRERAIQGLWEYESLSLLARLKKIVLSDADSRVRAEAALGIGRFILKGEIGKLPEEEKRDALESLGSVIDNELDGVDVRSRALEAIGACSQDWVKEAIRSGYESNEYRMVVSAIHAMGRSCDETWLPILLRELASDYAEIRYEAALACGLVGDIKAVPALANLLDDEDPDVQAVTITALGQIGGSEAKDILKGRLGDEPGDFTDLLEDALAEAEFAEDPLGFRLQF